MTTFTDVAIRIEIAGIGPGVKDTGIVETIETIATTASVIEIIETEIVGMATGMGEDMAIATEDTMVVVDMATDEVATTITGTLVHDTTERCYPEVFLCMKSCDA